MKPESAELLSRQALHFLERGQSSEALAAYQRLVTMVPDDADGWYHLALAQRQMRQFEDALISYQAALDKGVSEPAEVHVNRSVILAHLERNREAEAELEAALSHDPKMVLALMNLGNLQEDGGHRERAQATYERVLAIEPDNALALARLAGVSDIDRPSHPVIARLEQASRRPEASSSDRAALSFALGQALDAVGRYDEAFAAYVAANRANRASLGPAAARYDAAAVERSIDEIIRVFGSPVAVERRRDVEPPLFICGMFRSGSTLIEQMLGAHSGVSSGGELDLLPSLVRRELKPYPTVLADAGPATFARLRDLYLNGLRAINLGPGLVTDKRPDNFLHIGLIKALFPDAKIVHTVRDPLDNCLSIYFLHLHPGIAYAHELGDIAHWYGQYRRLMAHWRSLYADDIFELDYDKLVADPKPVLEEVLRFCELDWEKSCLSFHERKSRVKTASVWQVRKPLYQRSSGRWRNYEAVLKDLAFNFDTLKNG